MKLNPLIEKSLVRLYRKTCRSRDYFSREVSRRIVNICLLHGIPILKKHAELGIITTTTWFPFTKSLDELKMIINYANALEGHAHLTRALRGMYSSMTGEYQQSLRKSRWFYKRIHRQCTSEMS